MLSLTQFVQFKYPTTQMLLFCLHILASSWYWIPNKSPKPSSTRQCLSIPILELRPGETTVWEKLYFQVDLTPVHADRSAQANFHRAAQHFPTQVYYIGTHTINKAKQKEESDCGAGVGIALQPTIRSGKDQRAEAAKGCDGADNSLHLQAALKQTSWRHLQCTLQQKDIKKQALKNVIHDVTAPHFPNW